MSEEGKGRFLTVPVILILAIAIPVFILGMCTVIAFFRFMFSPILGGGIPVWVILVVIAAFFMLKPKKRGVY